MAAPSLTLPKWYRIFAVIVGVMSIALSLIVLIEPGLAIWLLIFFLAFALLVIGVDRLVAGITGHPFGWMMSMGGTGAAPPAGTPPGPMPPSKP